MINIGDDFWLTPQKKQYFSVVHGPCLETGKLVSGADYSNVQCPNCGTRITKAAIKKIIFIYPEHRDCVYLRKYMDLYA